MTDAPSRRSFGPVVLTGLASAGLAALAGDRRWAAVDDGAAGTSMVSVATSAAGRAPAVTAVALVVLAAWGVLLVARGAVRRGVAVVLAAASVGLAGAAVAAARAAPDDVRAAVATVGRGDLDPGYTAWAVVGVAAATVAAAAAVPALWLVRDWPEMGRRYDAPADPPEGRETRPASDLELWKAFDEGRDPTA